MCVSSGEGLLEDAKKVQTSLLGEFLQSGEDRVHKMPSNDHKHFIKSHIEIITIHLLRKTRSKKQTKRVRK